MLKTFDIAPYAETTVNVVQDVFRTMLCSEVHGFSAHDYNMRSTDISAAIFFNGEWKGGTYIECSEEQATLFTEQLMNIPRPNRIDSDTRDAMGELVNMIGGNLKSVLPKGVSLSLPCVMEGKNYSFHVCNVNESYRIAFKGASGTFWVTFFNHIK